MKKQLLVLLIAVFIGFGANAQVKSSETNVLVLIYSQSGGTYKMANSSMLAIGNFSTSAFSFSFVFIEGTRFKVALVFGYS